jgi:hypothetical protein
LTTALLVSNQDGAEEPLIPKITDQLPEYFTRVRIKRILILISGHFVLSGNEVILHPRPWLFQTKKKKKKKRERGTEREWKKRNAEAQKHTKKNIRTHNAKGMKDMMFSKSRNPIG